LVIFGGDVFGGGRGGVLECGRKGMGKIVRAQRRHADQPTDQSSQPNQITPTTATRLVLLRRVRGVAHRRGDVPDPVVPPA
jgi:hypothetical protein